MFLITCTTLTMETPKTDKASGDSVVAVQNLNADTDENGEINVNDVTQLQFMIANNN